MLYVPKIPDWRIAVRIGINFHEHLGAYISFQQFS
jgi:hypothetical protein